MQKTTPALVAFAAVLGFLSQVKAFDSEESKSETSKLDADTLSLYLLQPYDINQEDKDRIKKIETALEHAPQQGLASEFQINEISAANKLQGTASVNWRNASDTLHLFVEGSYEADLAGSGWQSKLKPSLGFQFQPGPAISFALRLHHRNDLASDSFEDQSMQSKLAFHF